MSLIRWNESLSVNVAEIDRQHRKLVSLINELDEAMKQGKGKAVLGKTVDSLVQYAVTHFRTEERYFDRFGYPDTDGHKKEHAAFVRKASEIKDKFEQNRNFLSIEVMNFLINWLQNHIMKSDKQYSQFFNDKGLR